MLEAVKQNECAVDQAAPDMSNKAAMSNGSKPSALQLERLEKAELLEMQLRRTAAIADANALFEVLIVLVG